MQRPRVTERLKLHDELSDKVKEFVGQKMIDEGHLLEIMRLSVNRHLFSWLTIEEAHQGRMDEMELFR